MRPGQREEALLGWMKRSQRKALRDRPHLGGLLWKEGVDQVGRFLIHGRAVNMDFAQLFDRAVAEDQVQEGQRRELGLGFFQLVEPQVPEFRDLSIFKFEQHPILIKTELEFAGVIHEGGFGQAGFQRGLDDLQEGR